MSTRSRTNNSVIIPLGLLELFVAIDFTQAALLIGRYEKMGFYPGGMLCN